MALNYKLLPKASIELDDAIEWYRKKAGVKVATKFAKDYAKTRNKILENPNLFAKVASDCHQISLDKFPYVIIYLPMPTEILIVSIFHTSRNPIEWQSRI